MSLCSAPPRAGMPLAYYMQPLPDSNEPITGQDVLQATPTLNSNQLQVVALFFCLLASFSISLCTVESVKEYTHYSVNT